jgi:hypothetical protein
MRSTPDVDRESKRRARRNAAARIARARPLAAGLAAAILAACGGGEMPTDADPQAAVPRAERARAAATSSDATTLLAESLRTGGGGFTYKRAGPATTPDYDGVHLPLAADEPGFLGARRVKNEFLNSENPTLWSLLADDSSYDAGAVVSYAGAQVGALRVTHAQGQQRAPFVMQNFGSGQTARAPGLFSSRFELRQTSGQTGLSWTHQGRTAGTGIGSESNSPRTSLPLTSSNWQSTSQTLQLFEPHQGWTVQAPLTLLDVAATFEVVRMQFEDVTGFKAGKEWSSEYVPSSGSPGVRWFETTKATSRTCCTATNPAYGTFNASNQPVSAGGALTQGTGSTVDVKGLLLEPAATNLSRWNTLGFVGVAVLDSGARNYSFVAPAAAGSSAIYLDPRSGRHTYRAGDLTFTKDAAGDRITSTTTDFVAQGWRAGMSIWLHVTESAAGAGNGGVYGPYPVASVVQRTITLGVDGVLPVRAAGQYVNIARVPAVGDDILVARNDGSMHASRVTGVTLPSIPQSTGSDGYQHLAVRLTIAQAMPADGIHGGIAGTNNNQPVYYFRRADLPVASTRADGSAPGGVSVVRDWQAAVAAGIGFQTYPGLVYELAGGAAGARFELQSASGAAGRHTSASAWMRRVSGSGTPRLAFGNATGTAFTNAGFQRIEWRGTSTDTKADLVIDVPAGTVVHAVLPQVVQATASGSEVAASSIIVTGAAPATRAQAALTRPWTWTALTQPSIRLDWTPTAPPMPQRQTLWSAWNGANDHAEIAVVGTSVEFVRQQSSGKVVAKATIPNFDVGQPMTIEALALGTAYQVLVDGQSGPTIAGTFAALPTGTTMMLGSLNGSHAAQGAVRNLALGQFGSASASAKAPSSVNAAPTVSVAAPATASVGAPVVLSATASDGDGSVSRVDFYVGGSMIGSDTTAPYSVSWQPVVSGTQSVSARATDNLGAQAASATAQVNVAAAGTQAGAGLLGSYYSNPNLSGTPVLTRLEAIDLTWSKSLGTTSPGSGLPSDGWSVRWNGSVQLPAAGTYTFEFRADDGARVWLDGAKVIDKWAKSGNTYYTVSITAAGSRRVPIVFEHFDGTGDSTARMRWKTPGSSKYWAVVPASQLHPD